VQMREVAGRHAYSSRPGTTSPIGNPQEIAAFDGTRPVSGNVSRSSFAVLSGVAAEIKPGPTRKRPEGE